VAPENPAAGRREPHCGKWRIARPVVWINPKSKEAALADTTNYIFRQCITLRNGKRICMPPGRAFRIPVHDNDNKKSDKQAG
jgi:hypothetical protein